MKTRLAVVLALTAGLAGLSATPASAAPVALERTSATCVTSEFTGTVTFTVARDVTQYGTLRAVTVDGSGAFSSDPKLRVYVRDAAGRTVVTKYDGSGGMNLPFWRAVGTTGWTAEAVVPNTLGGACSTGRVQIALPPAA